MKRKKKSQKVLVRYIYCIIIAAIVCLIAGYWIGAIMTLKWGIGVASNFMNITIDDDKIAYAIWQYKNHISECYG